MDCVNSVETRNRNLTTLNVFKPIRMFFELTSVGWQLNRKLCSDMNMKQWTFCRSFKSRSINNLFFIFERILFLNGIFVNKLTCKE